MLTRSSGAWNYTFSHGSAPTLSVPLHLPNSFLVCDASKRKVPLDTAHRAKQNCGQVFRYAIATGRAERDPMPDLRGALTAIQKQYYYAAITDP